MKRIRYLLVPVVIAGAAFVLGQSQQPEISAPVVDRIGFPYGYQNNYKLLYVFDQFQNRQIRVVYGNDVAADSKPGEPLPYGSVLVGEFYAALRDPQGEPVLDANGRFIRDGQPTVFVMRKERGFGAAYKSIRNGEWEYVSFRPDGTYATRPEGTMTCATCHLQAGAQRDWVFRMNLYWHGASGAQPDGVIKNFRYVPGNLRVRPGQAITIYNDDDADFHTFTADNGAFDSGRVDGGASFTFTLTQPGRYDYHCNRHARMRGTVIVE